jgi:hypothetical protein
MLSVVTTSRTVVRWWCVSRFAQDAISKNLWIEDALPPEVNDPRRDNSPVAVRHRRDIESGANLVESQGERARGFRVEDDAVHGRRVNKACH